MFVGSLACLGVGLLAKKLACLDLELGRKVGLVERKLVVGWLVLY